MERPGSKSSADKARRREANRDAALATVREALKELQYGVITITVQDGVVVQVERTERRRLP